MNVQEYIEIEATPEIVFEYLVDVKNRKEYIPQLEEVILLDPLPLKKGSRYLEVALIAGRRIETTYQIIAFEEPRRMVARTLQSIFPIEVELQILDLEDYVKIVIRLEFTLSGIFKIASGIVQNIVRQQARDILRKIKFNVEGKSIT